MKRAAPAVFIAIVMWFVVQPHGFAQQSPLATGPSVLTETRNTALRLASDSAQSLRELNTLVEARVREGTLAARVVYDDVDVPGRRHESFVQTYNGVPVYGANVMRQTAGGATVSIFGTVYSDINIDVSPQLTRSQAAAKLDEGSGSTRITSADPTLTVLPLLDGQFALAYFAPMRDTFTYFVDANDGVLLRRDSNIDSQSAVGSGRGVLGDSKKISTTQIGGAFRSRDGLRPATILTLDARSSVIAEQRFALGARWSDSDLAVDSDNVWTDPAVVDAHAHMGWVYDYYFKTHRHQGLDGRNSPMIGVVATRAAIQDNAFFISPPFGPDGNGGMFFGESSSGVPMTALDIVGHELTHGVVYFSLTQRTGRDLGDIFPIDVGPSTVTVGGRGFSCATTTIAGRPFSCDGAGRYRLVSNHSGALNEGLADSFGTAVEFFFQPSGTGPQRADYLMGEDLPGPSGFAPPVRSLENPATLPIYQGSIFRYPDHYARRVSFALYINSRGQLDISPLAFVGSVGEVEPDTDNGSVHMNATIMSHAFYLAIEGGANRTSGVTVQGVGAANRSQIEQVYFRALRNLIPNGVTFPQMAAALRQAAVDLYGAGGAPTRAVDQALTAVGL